MEDDLEEQRRAKVLLLNFYSTERENAQMLLNISTRSQSKGGPAFRQLLLSS